MSATTWSAEGVSMSPLSLASEMLKAPEVVIGHQPLPLVQSVGVFSGELFYQPICSCGYRGSWVGLESQARTLWTRHAESAA